MYFNVVLGVIRRVFSSINVSIWVGVSFSESSPNKIWAAERVE